ncbi:MAG: hypothetical protein ACHP9T_16100 [Caulobacterales bacterium]|jgi:hypothetical protein
MADPQTGKTGDKHPGMFGDGTEEQNLNQKGDPGARITEGEVKDAFKDKAANQPKP